MALSINKTLRTGLDVTYWRIASYGVRSTTNGTDRNCVVTLFGYKDQAQRASDIMSYADTGAIEVNLPNTITGSDIVAYLYSKVKESRTVTQEVTPAVPAVLDGEGNVVTPEVPAVTEEVETNWFATATDII